MATYNISVLSTSSTSNGYRFSGSDKNGSISSSTNNPTINIDNGDTINFTFSNGTSHPFTISGTTIDEESATGGSYSTPTSESYTFSSTMTYTYFCENHGSMTGSIIASAVSSTTTTTSPPTTTTTTTSAPAATTTTTTTTTTVAPSSTTTTTTTTSSPSSTTTTTTTTTTTATPIANTATTTTTTPPVATTTTTTTTTTPSPYTVKTWKEQRESLPNLPNGTELSYSPGSIYSSTELYVAFSTSFGYTLEPGDYPFSQYNSPPLEGDNGLDPLSSNFGRHINNSSPTLNITTSADLTDLIFEHVGVDDFVPTVVPVPRMRIVRNGDIFYGWEIDDEAELFDKSHLKPPYYTSVFDEANKINPVRFKFYYIYSPNDVDINYQISAQFDNDDLILYKFAETSNLYPYAVTTTNAQYKQTSHFFVHPNAFSLLNDSEMSNAMGNPLRQRGLREDSVITDNPKIFKHGAGKYKIGMSIQLGFNSFARAKIPPRVLTPTYGKEGDIVFGRTIFDVTEDSINLDPNGPTYVPDTGTVVTTTTAPPVILDPFDDPLGSQTYFRIRQSLLSSTITEVELQWKRKGQDVDWNTEVFNYSKTGLSVVLLEPLPSNMSIGYLRSEGMEGAGDYGVGIQTDPLRMGTGLVYSDADFRVGTKKYGNQSPELERKKIFDLFDYDKFIIRIYQRTLIENCIVADDFDSDGSGGKRLVGATCFGSEAGAWAFKYHVVSSFHTFESEVNPTTNPDPNDIEQVFPAISLGVVDRGWMIDDPELTQETRYYEQFSSQPKALFYALPRTTTLHQNFYGIIEVDTGVHGPSKSFAVLERYEKNDFSLTWSVPKQKSFILEYGETDAIGSVDNEYKLYGYEFQYIEKGGQWTEWMRITDDDNLGEFGELLDATGSVDPATPNWTKQTIISNELGIQHGSTLQLVFNSDTSFEYRNFMRIDPDNLYYNCPDEDFTNDLDKFERAIDPGIDQTYPYLFRGRAIYRSIIPDGRFQTVTVLEVASDWTTMVDNYGSEGPKGYQSAFTRGETSQPSFEDFDELGFRLVGTTDLVGKTLKGASCHFYDNFRGTDDCCQLTGIFDEWKVDSFIENGGGEA